VANDATLFFFCSKLSTFAALYQLRNFIFMENQNRILLSTAYLPPVHYVSAMMAADEVIIEQHETYPRQTYRNRCEIATANGRLPLSIPVHKPNGNHTKTLEIITDSQTNWQLLHWRAIHTAYANSPFFLYYQDELLDAYKKNIPHLIHFNHHMLSRVLSLLGIDIKIHFTNRFEKHPAGLKDLRNAFTPKHLPPAGGFKKYHQVFINKHGFISGLSILDLLMNEGKEGIHYL
jgi:hypothetical protein